MKLLQKKQMGNISFQFWKGGVYDVRIQEVFYKSFWTNCYMDFLQSILVHSNKQVKQQILNWQLCPFKANVAISPEATIDAIFYILVEYFALISVSVWRLISYLKQILNSSLTISYRPRIGVRFLLFVCIISQSIWSVSVANFAPLISV